MVVVHAAIAFAMPLEPASLLALSHLAAFLAGATTHAAGKYLADRFTDQRHRQEAEVAERHRFNRVRDMMPELLREMTQDLTTSVQLAPREFVVLSSERFPYTNDRALRYYETVHPDAKNQVSVLVAEGYADEIRADAIPIFRLNEEFVSRLVNDARRAPRRGKA